MVDRRQESANRVKKQEEIALRADAKSPAKRLCDTDTDAPKQGL